MTDFQFSARSCDQDLFVDMTSLIFTGACAGAVFGPSGGHLGLRDYPVHAGLLRPSV